MNDCIFITGVKCPESACPGRLNASICDHLARLNGWRSLSTDEQIQRLGARNPTIDPVVRERVNRCPSRGNVLPISLQDDCGCRGKELSECRAGVGKIAGRVTLSDCLECQGSKASA